MSAVPAWKRLGLKLKGASSDGSPVPASQTTTSAPLAARPSYRQQQLNSNGRSQQYGYDNGTPFNKKRQFSGSYTAPDNKRPRRDDSDFTPSKRVSFSQDTKKAAPKKPKKKKTPKPQTPKQPFDFTPVVEYLRTWHKARDSWKFNKNHQTLLIKYLYESDAIPSSDIETFYLYISDIKGGSRKRLVEQAKEIIKKDMEDGIKGFAQGTQAPQDKQKQYEELLAKLLKEKADIKDGSATNGNGKRSFDEVEFALRTMDKQVQQRVVKRMRAEIIVDKLESSNSGESTNMSATVPSNASSSRVKVPVINGDAEAGNSKEAPKLKTKRRNKLRTAGSDSSSSESESSDSGSDSDGPGTGGKCSSSSSSSSDSDSDDDEVMQTAAGLPVADASSSSSSSSSESDSDSGPAVANDDDSGSEGDSESSDDDDDDDDDDDA